MATSTPSTADAAVVATVAPVASATSADLAVSRFQTVTGEPGAPQRADHRGTHPAGTDHCY